MQRIGLSLIVSLVSFAPSAFSQFDTATVLGTIQDPAGAVVPQCAVTLENVETGILVEASTDAVGNFEFFNVKIGSYQVSVEQTGFKRAVSNAFTVTVNARQRVDLTLEAGAVTETVEVTDVAALLEVDTSSRGTVVGHRDWHSSISAFTKTSPCRERDREWNSVRSSSTCSTEPTFERPRAGGMPAVSGGLPALSQLARSSLR